MRGGGYTIHKKSCNISDAKNSSELWKYLTKNMLPRNQRGIQPLKVY